MDTNEARTRMRDLALEAIRIVDMLARSETLQWADRATLRELVVQARRLLADAGYPGEGVWRGLQRASLGAETGFGGDDPGYWQELGSDLRGALDTLNSLVAPPSREADVHIIG